MIDQEGRPVEDTVRMPRLRFALWGQVDARDLYAAPEGERTVPLPVVAGPTRPLPVHGHGTIALRVPAAPKPPTKAHPASLFDDPGFVTDLTLIQMQAHHDVYELVRAFDRRAAVLRSRVEALGQRVRSWTLAGLDADMAAAYAEGGTERLLKLTPQVLARLDAQATAGQAVAA